MKMTNRLIAFLLLISSCNQVFAAEGAEEEATQLETPEQVLLDMYHGAPLDLQGVSSYATDTRTLSLIDADQYQQLLQEKLTGPFARSPLSILLLDQDELETIQQSIKNPSKLVYFFSSSLNPANINDRLEVTSSVIDKLSELYCLPSEKSTDKQKRKIISEFMAGAGKFGRQELRPEIATLLAALRALYNYNRFYKDEQLKMAFYSMTSTLVPQFSYEATSEGTSRCQVMTDIKTAFDGMKALLTNAGPITLDAYFKYSTDAALFAKAVERYKEGFIMQQQQRQEEEKEARKPQPPAEPTLAQWTAKTVEETYDAGKKALDDLVASVWRRPPPTEGQKPNSRPSSPRQQGASGATAAAHQLVVADEEEEMEKDMLPELCSLFNRTEQTLALAQKGTAQEPTELKQSWALLAEFLNTTPDQFAQMTKQGFEANVKKIQPLFPLNAPLEVFFGVTDVNDLTQALVNNQFEKFEAAAKSESEGQQMFLATQRDFVNEQLKEYGVNFSDNESFMKGVRQARYQFAQVLGIERYKALMEDLKAADASFRNLTQLQKAFGAATKEVGLDVQKCNEISMGLNLAKMPTEGKAEIEEAYAAISALNEQTKACPHPSALQQAEMYASKAASAVLNLLPGRNSTTPPAE